MNLLHTKYVMDQQGQPVEVIIPYQEFQEMVEILGLDLEEETKLLLKQAQQDGRLNKLDSYVSIDAV